MSSTCLAYVMSNTGVWEESTHFQSAFALQSCSRNWSPAPDLVFWRLICLCVLLSGGAVLSQTPVRPISLLRLSLLRFVDSKLPGNSLWTWELHTFKSRFCLSLNPLKSRIFSMEIGRMSSASESTHPMPLRRFWRWVTAHRSAPPKHMIPDLHGANASRAVTCTRM